MSSWGKAVELVMEEEEEEEERTDGKIWSQSSGGRWRIRMSLVETVDEVEKGDEGLGEE